MFRGDIDNMLPRAAPKPTAPNLDFTEPKPTVPEVSLLFGAHQQASTQSHLVEKCTTTSSGAQPLQSYAAWRRQNLSNLNYQTMVTDGTPANTKVNQNSAGQPSYSGNINANNASKCYFMRGSINVNTAPSATSLDSVASTEARSSPAIPCSIDSPVFFTSPSAMTATSTGVKYSYQTQTLPSSQPQPKEQRHSLDALQVPTFNTPPVPEVMTLCASTQTDFHYSNDREGIPQHQCAIGRQEFQMLMETLHAMREDQAKITQLFELLLQRQSTAWENIRGTEANLQVRNVAIQCEVKASTTPSTQNHMSTRPTPLHNYEVLGPTAQFQSPQSKPSAQSTTYKPPTPSNVVKKAANLAVALPKPATEKSMFMNELALKYLPGEKLNELMHDIHISPSTQSQTQHHQQTETPLRSLENVKSLEKGPSDISNASLKYMKKYRLIAEDNENNKHDNMDTPLRAATPTAAGTNFATSGATPVSTRPCNSQPMELDLERLRGQPKLL